MRDLKYSNSIEVRKGQESLKIGRLKGGISLKTSLIKTRIWLGTSDLTNPYRQDVGKLLSILIAVLNGPVNNGLIQVFDKYVRDVYRESMKCKK